MHASPSPATLKPRSERHRAGDRTVPPLQYGGGTGEERARERARGARDPRYSPVSKETTMIEQHRKVPQPEPEHDEADADIPDLITFMQASPLAAMIAEDGID